MFGATARTNSHHAAEVSTFWATRLALSPTRKMPRDWDKGELKIDAKIIGHNRVAVSSPSLGAEEGNGAPLPVFPAQQAGSTDSRVITT